MNAGRSGPSPGGLMQAKTYQAGTMKEALAQVRRDLGGDAVILASREVRRRRFFGLRSRDLIEVTAADRASAPSRAAQAEPATATAAPTALEGAIQTWNRRGPVEDSLPDLPRELVAVYARLIEADVPETTARRLVRHVVETLDPERIHRVDLVDECLRGAVEQCISVAPPIRAVPGARRVVALVGPTGVGKTTTAAKLAASYKLTRGVRVGLVTVDTYRIAAVEQLRTFAEIIDLPLAVVNHPGEMSRAVENLGPVDLVFVDTAGRAPRDESRIQELADFLDEAGPDETHLVLSMVAGGKSLRGIVERFAAVRADRLILTKLDEAECLGGILSVLGWSDLPISYATTGQTVPDDYEPADRRRLARLILGLDSAGTAARAEDRAGSGSRTEAALM